VSIDIIQARYHTLLPIKVYEFPWLRNNKTPVMLKVAFLPPDAITQDKRTQIGEKLAIF
jgi:hypothetical protein